MSENNGKIGGVNSKKSLIAEERHPRKVGTDVVVRRAFNVWLTRDMGSGTPTQRNSWVEKRVWLGDVQISQCGLRSLRHRIPPCTV
jgi:hypothetical protein